MKVGNREFSGKGAREEAGNMLNTVVMSWRDDKTPQVRAHLKGFEILSRGSPLKDGEPELFIRGKETYKANLNPENPLGTIQSIEHVLRGLDRKAEEEQWEIGRRRSREMTHLCSVIVENGLIYLVGGFNAASGDLTTALSYNPATNAWTTEASLKLAKSNSAAALLGSTIVSAGGLTNPSVTTSDTEGYNPATNSWSSLAPIPTARQVGCFGVLGQLLYVAGGTSSGSVESPVNVMEAYSAASNAWTTGLPQMPTAVVAPGSATVGGALYCFGGTNQATVVSNMQIYEPPSSPPAISAAISASGFGGSSSIAPGTWIEIYGSNLAADTRQWAASDFNGINAPTMLDGTKVTIGGQSAFIDYISPSQVNALVPSNVPTGLQQIMVTTAVGTSAAYNVTVNTAEPGLLSPSSFTIGGVQYAVALFTDGTYVLPTGAISGVNSRPAKPGDTIVLYGIGFGPVTPAMTAGQIVGQLNSLSMPFQVSIGGVPATPIYDGLALNFAGLYQFNLTVPNLSAGNAALTFTLGGTAGIQTLYIAIGN